MVTLNDEQKSIVINAVQSKALEVDQALLDRSLSQGIRRFKKYNAIRDKHNTEIVKILDILKKM